jgi:hypothetical protein
LIAEVARGYAIEEQHERLTTGGKVGKCVPGKRLSPGHFNFETEPYTKA